MSGIRAQDKRFEYADSALIQESPSTSMQEYTDEEDNVPEDEKDILSDTTIYITDINISPDSVLAWKQNKRFGYVNNLDSLLKIKQQEDLDNYQQAVKQKPNNFLKKLFSSGMLQIFFWIVAMSFVVFVLYKLFFSNGIFKKNMLRTTVSEVQEKEIITTIADYDKLVLQSVKQADYRMAIRYLFLKTLMQLSEKEYIHYATGKTNYQYAEEISSDKKNEFAALVLNYEYIWYGNFQLPLESYTVIEKKFSSFFNHIQ